jgi:hypothetical protein
MYFNFVISTVCEIKHRLLNITVYIYPLSSRFWLLSAFLSEEGYLVRFTEPVKDVITS